MRDGHAAVGRLLWKQKKMPTRKLVLIVEDEPLIAMTIESVVAELGLVPRTCLQLDAALELARLADLAGAVVDFKMQDGDTGELAAVLRARGVPIIVSTGADQFQAADAFAEAPVLRKPYADDDLKRELRRFQSAAQPEVSMP